QQTSRFRLVSEAPAHASQRLERLAETFAAAAGQRADRSMMLWARRDPRIAPRVTRVLKRRLDYVASLLREHGLTTDEAQWRAQVIAFAYMGWLDRAAPSAATQAETRDWMRRLTALALAPSAERPRRRREPPAPTAAARRRKAR